MMASYPFMENIGHAQNTCISLLLMTWAVVAWRNGRAWYAGIAAGILFYKPQLAAVILAAMVVTLGWRALAGAFISLGSLLLLNILTLRGTLTDYLHRLAPNVQYYLATHPYLWRSHATFNGFWHVRRSAHSSRPFRQPRSTWQSSAPCHSSSVWPCASGKIENPLPATA